ncbi:hypothetical protein WICPIJ_001160 [Wickerhamomyces pijperi]|uniref:Palmitoyl-protein thioesterase 1 n=1 Tax=Wickerhamomyces pijperi TaxID=599730 RepID=A0A9P8QE95_WICPI|nr:hypothetical protein WICPIJ_001160 [Wickerhamomyces pijperi]
MVHFGLCHVVNFVWDRSEHLHDGVEVAVQVLGLTVRVDTGQDQQRAWDLSSQSEIQPDLQVVFQSGRRHFRGLDPSGDTGRLQLAQTQGLDAFVVNGLVVLDDLQHSVSDLVTGLFANGVQTSEETDKFGPLLTSGGPRVQSQRVSGFLQCLSKELGVMHLSKLALHILSTLNILKKITTIPDERPVVFWHGMGDSHQSLSMKRVFDLTREVKPDIFIHSVFIDEDDNKDQRASIIGNATAQVESVCQQLGDIKELENGFDMIGFSQGGLFARAAIEKCGLKVHNLITFGSPHAGVYDLPQCPENDWLCEKRNSVLKSQVYNKRVQGSVISAQYFRDTMNYETYLENSAFLADINNEKPESRNQTYADNLSQIDRLVLIQFEQDETLLPKESAWFYDSEKMTKINIPFEHSDFYNHDCVGLKKLYDENRIDYFSVDDQHMRFNDEFFKDIVEKYIGSPMQLDTEIRHVELNPNILSTSLAKSRSMPGGSSAMTGECVL